MKLTHGNTHVREMPHLKFNQNLWDDPTKTYRQFYLVP